MVCTVGCASNPGDEQPGGRGSLNVAGSSGALAAGAPAQPAIGGSGAGASSGGVGGFGGSFSEHGGEPSAGGSSTGGSGQTPDAGALGGSGAHAPGATGGDASAQLPPEPSPGCSLGAKTVTISNANVGYPEAYDGITPVPVIFAFHAAGNPNTQLENRFGDTVIGQEHLMIYLAATDSGWSLRADQDRFNTAMDQVLAGACVDQNRIYALGHSSGAQFIVQLLCDGETRFDAVIPIASSVYCNSWEPVPTLNFHGLDDQERWAYGLDDGDGRKDIVPYRTSNGCEMTTQPSDIDTSGCGADITPGCVEFQGCSEATLWCNHDDPQYGTSNHGIPCFATSAIYDFLRHL